MDNYNDIEINDILSVNEVAKILHSGKTIVYELLENGELKGFRINKNHGNWRIPRAAVTEFIKKQSRI